MPLKSPVSKLNKPHIHIFDFQKSQIIVTIKHASEIYHYNQGL